MSNNLFISIILCCYNSEKYIDETLKSIKNQTYSNWELIIVDDGSSDSTEMKIKNFIINNKKLNIKYYYINNSGLPEARNYAIKKTCYEWISIIDHDDIWKNNKLEIQTSDIKKYPNNYLFFSDFNITKDGNLINSKFKIAESKDKFKPAKLNLSKKNAYLNLIQYGCFIGSSTVIFNKKIFTKIDYFNKKYKFICVYIFFIEVGKKYNMFCSPNILTTWRSHSNQATVRMNKTYFLEMFKLYSKIYLMQNVILKIKLIVLYKQLRLIISFIIKKI
jgi:glycosyltransferase involved in cell wall biosynthesis